MRWILVVGGLWAGYAAALEHKTASCNDSDFLKGGWQDLCVKEPRICEELAAIARASGEPGPVIPMTNCLVRWPVDDKGKSVDGIRTVVMDKVWYEADGVLAHGGMRIYYHHKVIENVGLDGAIYFGSVRSIRGFAFCRTPKICEAMAIPVRGSAIPSVTRLPLRSETRAAASALPPRS